LREAASLIELLPHGPKARMVDHVCAHVAGGIETEKQWTQQDARIVDHFPEGPFVVPGVFLVEQVAQSALLLAILDGHVTGKNLFVVGHFRSDFLRPALVPCRVVARVTLTARVRGSVGFQGECHADDRLLARIKGVALPAPDTP